MSNNVALFADVSSLYNCVNKKYDKRKLDYQKLLKLVDGNLYRSYAYGVILNDDTNKFISCLRHYGFETFFVDNPKYRIDWNLTIAVDVFRLIDRVDTVILCSASVNLYPLITWIREKSVKVIIQACHIPVSLKRCANGWIEMDEKYLEKLDNDVTSTTAE